MPLEQPRLLYYVSAKPMATATPDLFAEQTTHPLADWVALERDLNASEYSDLQLWKDRYEKWKHAYSKFRRMEHAYFYQASDGGRLPSPSDLLMAYHRKVISALMFKGQDCVETLIRLSVTPEEKGERDNCRIRIETLLSALRESMELWHPANKERLESIRGKLEF